MSGGAGVTAPGAPNLPATMDNFDAIIGSYDNEPAAPPAQPAAAKPAKLADVAPVGDEGVEGEEQELIEGEEGEPVEPEAPAPELEELARLAQEWTDSPELPEAFYSKKGVARVNGEDHVITVKEAFDAYQRRAITTQAQQEARAAKQYHEQMIQAERAQRETWTRDPNRLESDLEDMELGPHLDWIVKKRFQQFSEEQSVLDAIQDPKHREAAARRFQNEKAMAMRARAQEREAARQRSLAEQNQGQTQQEQLMQRTARQMAQHGPKALAEVGLKNTPYTRSLLGREVKAGHKWGTDLTYEQVLDAARTAKDFHDLETEQALEADIARRTKSKAIPPRRSPAGSSSVKRASPPASQKPARLSDFDEIMRQWDGGR